MKKKLGKEKLKKKNMSELTVSAVVETIKTNASKLTPVQWSLIAGGTILAKLGYHFLSYQWNKS